MKKTPSPKEWPKGWMEEFNEFISAEPVQPPQNVTENIVFRVHSDLNPTSWLVFAKLSAIHAVVGFVTLLFCPQFGFGFTEGMGLMALFMKYGDQVCMLGCGAVFMSGSALTASLLLKREELRAIRKVEALQISALALISMGVFICAGVGIVMSLGAFWVLGSILGGIGTFEAGVRIRGYLDKRAHI